MTLKLTGKKFGCLTAISYAGGGRWHCTCSCGKETAVHTNNLTSGKTRSCGHLRGEVVAAAHTTHGHTKRGRVARTYRIWRNMVERCTNPKIKAWKRYGGRGITIAEEWRSYENFLWDMGETPGGLTIERKDNDRGYSKDNCVWATRSEQARNTSRTRMITYLDETKCLEDWADALKVHRTTVRNWIGEWGDDEGIARLCRKRGYPHVE